MNETPRTVERIGTSALRIVWADGHESLYPWPYLRARCPCAVCRPYEAMGVPRATPAPTVSPEVRATAMAPVGRYAVHLTWSDGHATGIYAYDYLRQLCPCEACQPKQFEEG